VRWWGHDKHYPPPMSKIIKNIFIIIKTIIMSIIGLTILTTILFGMAFVVGVLLYVFSGNDTLLKYMGLILARILRIGDYVNV
jgi:hypothetical protein